MSQGDLAFFIAGLMVFFVFALAVQMRILSGIALKRAARAKFETLDDGTARFAVANAVSGPMALEPGDEAGDAAHWLAGEYPTAIRHIRLARKVSVAMPVLLVLVAAVWRFTVGGEG